MPPPKNRRCCPAQKFGPVDVETINRTLGTELVEGDLYLSQSAHWHIAKDHPGDYDMVMAVLPHIGSRYLLIGQSPKHGSNFEIVARIRSALDPLQYVLIAVGLHRDEAGCYRVRSAYRIKDDVVDRRRLMQRLLPPRA